MSCTVKEVILGYFILFLIFMLTGREFPVLTAQENCPSVIETPLATPAPTPTPGPLGHAWNFYVSNGGIGETRVFLSDADTPQTFCVIRTPEEANISRLGYVFIVWNTESDGSGMDFMPGMYWSDVPRRRGGRTTLYAIWKPSYDATATEQALVSD